MRPQPMNAFVQLIQLVHVHTKPCGFRAEKLQPLGFRTRVPAVDARCP
jgi:hypothetical protein